MPRRKTSFFKSKWLKKTGQGFAAFIWKALPWGLALGVIAFFFFSIKETLHADPYFKLEMIKVFPSGVLTPSEYQYLESKTRGQSLFDVPIKEIANQLERNPKVKRAEVVRKLPNQLTLFLATRSPLVQVRVKENGFYYLVASDQLILLAQKSPRADLLTVEDFSSEKKSYTVGSLYQNPHFRQLFDLLEALKSDPILSKQNVSKLNMDQLGDITLILQDGIELKIGAVWTIPDSVRIVLNSLLTSENRKEILYIDLRYRDIIVKKKSEEPYDQKK